MAEEDIQPLVCDNGTGMVKVGYPVIWSVLNLVSTNRLQLIIFMQTGGFRW